MNKEYLNVYKKTQQSVNIVATPHEIVRSLMKELVNSMNKIVMDIQYDKKKSNPKEEYQRKSQRNIKKKSKNFSKTLSIIYGLQVSLDFDKSQEISISLFQLYEYCRQQIIKGFSKQSETEIIKSMDVIREIVEGWELIPNTERQL
jgi:flagellar protein FliS